MSKQPNLLPDSLRKRQVPLCLGVTCRAEILPSLTVHVYAQFAIFTARCYASYAGA